MKKYFDIHHYRELGEDYNKKLIYINGCLFEARKCSIRNAINELKYISLQVKEYCVITEIRLPDNIPSGRKMLRQCDAAIINYVSERIEYFSGLDELSVTENKNPNKSLPPLPECFIDTSFWTALLLNPEIKDLYELNDGQYRWIARKNQLSGLALRLSQKGKLKEGFEGGEGLARIFCSFFNVKFCPKEFQPGRANTDFFRWIN